MGTKTWVDGVVACPLHHSANVSNASLISSDAIVSVGVQQLLAALMSHKDFSKDVVQDDVFPFATTTILYALIALEDIIFGVLTLWMFHGFRIYSMPSSKQVEGSDATPKKPRHASVFAENASFAQENASLLISTSPRYNSSLTSPDMSQGAAQQPNVVAIRLVTRSTDNKMWGLYFLSLAVVRLINVGTLVYAANFDSEAEAVRIASLVERLSHGVTCVWLAVALNIQRLHRVRDNKRAKANAALLRQATWMNRFCFLMFAVFSVGDFVASHLVSNTSNVAAGLYWTGIAALLVLAVPSLISTFWVVLHEAVMQPTVPAKCVLVIGVVMHTVIELPPSFWNDHALQRWVLGNPCPLTDLSFFDILLVLHVMSTALIFVFVVLEHRRTATLAHRDYLAFCEDRLYRRIARTKAAAAGDLAVISKPKAVRNTQVVSILVPGSASTSVTGRSMSTRHGEDFPDAEPINLDDGAAVAGVDAASPTGNEEVEEDTMAGFVQRENDDGIGDITAY